MAAWWSSERSPIHEKAKAIEWKLRPLHRPAAELLAEITGHVERNEPREGWSKYARLRSEYMPRISNELLAVIGGIYLEKEGHDHLQPSRVLSFSTVAKRLVDLLAAQASKPPAQILIVGEERFEPVGAEIIRLRFPACDVWNLPFAAHEYGYLVAQHSAPPQLADLQGEVKRNVDLETMPNDPPDIECYLPSVRRYRKQVGLQLGGAGAELDYQPTVEELQRLQVAHVSHLFADAFATYFVGPAYVRALLLLGMRPDDTLRFPRGAMPPFNQRFLFALETLRFVSDRQSIARAPLDPAATAGLAVACDELERTWHDVLADAGAEDSYEDTKRQFAGTGLKPGWLRRVWDALGDVTLHQEEPVPVVYARWQEACDLEAALSGSGAEVPEEPDPWSVINAAWSLRWRDGLDPSMLETRAIDLLAGRTEPKPSDAPASRMLGEGGRQSRARPKQRVAVGVAPSASEYPFKRRDTTPKQPVPDPAGGAHK